MIEVERYFELRSIVFNRNDSYVKGRKQAIVEWLEMLKHIRETGEYPEGVTYIPVGIPVNKQWQLHIKYDKDIQALIKDGKVKLFRQLLLKRLHTRGRKKSGSNQTYVVLA